MAERDEPMDETAIRNLEETLRLFLHANVYQPHEMKAWAQGSSDPEEAARVRRDFEAALAGQTLSRERLAGRLNMPFESDEDMYGWLREAFDFVWRDGPMPSPY